MENGAYCGIYDFELEHTKDEKVTLCRNSFYCINLFYKEYLSYDTKISPENSFVAKKRPFLNIASFVHGVHDMEYDTGVYGPYHVTMATKRGNEEHFERISYSSYKMSSDKDIARFLNERDSLQDDRDAAMLLGDYFYGK